MTAPYRLRDAVSVELAMTLAALAAFAYLGGAAAASGQWGYVAVALGCLGLQTLSLKVVDRQARRRAETTP